MDRLLREGNPPAGQLASPKPQYKDVHTNNWEELKGEGGASYVKDKDVFTKLEAVLAKLADLESELATIKANQLSGDQKVQLSGTVASELRLYDRGYEAVPLVIGRDVGGTNSLTKNSDHILLEAVNPTGVSDISIVTDTTIPLDGVQFIVVDWEQQSTASLARASLVVSQFKNSNYDTFDKRTHVSGVGRRISVLDVSDLNGSYYVRVHAVDISGVSAKSVVRVNSLLAVSYEPGHIPIFVDDVTKKPYLPVKDTETVYKWLSNEAKPTIGIPYLAFGLEVDTGTIYYWDGMKWEVYNV